MLYVQSYIKAIRYVVSLVTFKDEKINSINYNDEFYLGLNGIKTELRVFYYKKQPAQTIIIFPGASPYAENHPGMIMLGHGLRNAGYNVFLPRIPSLKELKLEKENVDWFAHCYSELLKHDKINVTNVMVIGLSYGGATLLRASLDQRMQAHPPKSYLSYGTYYSINTALNFFLTGEISYNQKTYYIPPHEWGMIVLFYNFINTININYDQTAITKILKHRINDEEEEMTTLLNSLDDTIKQFVKKILNGKINTELKTMVKQIINNNKSLLEYLSPDLWAKKVNNKVFIIHGANDSMVPFTESILLHGQLPNSTLFISFLYEHREISSNRGILFKIKEILNMIKYFSKYFRYNK